jgi:hypothetical protein
LDKNGMLSYDEMNRLTATLAIGSGGLQFLPISNGAERIVNNQMLKEQLVNVLKTENHVH